MNSIVNVRRILRYACQCVMIMMKLPMADQNFSKPSEQLVLQNVQRVRKCGDVTSEARRHVTRTKLTSWSPATQPTGLKRDLRTCHMDQTDTTQSSNPTRWTETGSQFERPNKSERNCLQTQPTHSTVFKLEQLTEFACE